MERLKKFFHNKKGEFIVPYFWSTIILSLTVIALVFEIILRTKYYIKNIELNVSFIPLISILIGITIALIGLYNFGKER